MASALVKAGGRSVESMRLSFSSAFQSHFSLKACRERFPAAIHGGGSFPPDRDADGFEGLHFF